MSRRLRALYRRPLYVYLFTIIRMRLAAYPVVERYVPARGKILDLGCGYGIFSNYLALISQAREVTGVELNGRKLRYADKGLGNVRFSNQNIREHSDSGQYDCIVLLHVLHHLRSYEEQEEILERCCRLLKADGRLVVMEVNTRPLHKFALARLTDHTLYPGDRIYYRDEGSFVELFNRLGLRPEVVYMHRRRLYPQILYVCHKN